MRRNRFWTKSGACCGPTGSCILSCPNKAEYTDRRGIVNEFHVRELYRPELAALIASRFAHAAWYGQRPSFYSVVWPEQGAAQGEIFEVSERSAASLSPGHARPLYFIVVASASAARLAAIAPRVSVLADRDEWVHQDYEKVMRDLVATHRLAHDLDVCLEQANEVRAELVREHAERESVQIGRARRLVAENRQPAARDRSPRELFVVGRPAVAPGVACAQGEAALGLGLAVDRSRSPGGREGISRASG